MSTYTLAIPSDQPTSALAAADIVNNMVGVLAPIFGGLLYQSPYGNGLPSLFSGCCFVVLFLSWKCFPSILRKGFTNTLSTASSSSTAGTISDTNKDDAVATYESKMLDSTCDERKDVHRSV